MEKYIPAGFLFAGVANVLGAVGPSMAFTNPHLAQADPAVMSNFGLAMILLWGCAYLATANHWRQMRWLVAVFCVEKLFYSTHWVFWFRDNRDSLRSLYETDFMSGLFFSVYGINDFLFAIFFAIVFVKASTSRRSEPQR